MNVALFLTFRRRRSSEFAEFSSFPKNQSTEVNSHEKPNDMAASWRGFFAFERSFLRASHAW